MPAPGAERGSAFTDCTSPVRHSVVVFVDRVYPSVQIRGEGIDEKVKRERASPRRKIPDRHRQMLRFRFGRRRALRSSGSRTVIDFGIDRLQCRPAVRVRAASQLLACSVPLSLTVDDPRFYSCTASCYLKR
ncbi:hypothetical protein EVAR_48249_1 [Eumeta japonica]|uniref:Uncharacterized protein n=1 Tax=Eumeta variegata TaxID=151549 RepID=A0A4C1YHS6_EUMVA|nr:hypothetical protein EVAR_48249_1 [Eumeta japonica]